ncbi:PREDICTED: deoxyhypusine hydroxylase-like [Priapulus caudatus]|uniref:Deoxyhypusine hydroxylase n=1 Tax=Priapulus caudatus TaxID=37621 RepID=A0ABM1ECS6_PRICU|nr:PREDICTED: deoxyhypusine hydroxylase-like [Priapulus caudatus]
MASHDVSAVKKVGEILCNPQNPLKQRFRALFTLRNLGGSEAIDCISACFEDTSALLKHELAYCLGQMKDPYAIPVLVKILEDREENSMVRHEAGEALGAIGSISSLEVLNKHCSDPMVEVAETCQLAVRRLKWLHRPESERENLSANPYMSTDPAPPNENCDVAVQRAILLDESVPLFERYRAMFSLRNAGGEEAVLALAEGLGCGSALFRHEVAYVLGQMQHGAAAPPLARVLRDAAEHAMVRHECAEALGAIAGDGATGALRAHADDAERVVRESCQVALDMCEYESGDQFQYADCLAEAKVAEATS